VGSLTAIVVDCRHPASLARFWAQAIEGYQVRAYDDAEVARLAALGFTPETDPTVTVDGPGPTLFFVQVPEAKVTKNRLHIDVSAADRAAETRRLAELGAATLAEYATWTVLGDPEGNEFCVSDAH
jgi:hypothetical protein